MPQKVWYPHITFKARQFMSQKVILASEKKRNLLIESKIHPNPTMPSIISVSMPCVLWKRLGYPDVIFACTHCCSLDVYFEIDANSLVKGRCIDCKNEWFEISHKQ